jgi:hypothetical protein
LMDTTIEVQLSEITQFFLGQPLSAQYVQPTGRAELAR